MENTIKIFAVEDDPTYRKFLEYVLGLNPDFEVKFFNSGNDCIKHLHLKPSIVALDYTLPDMSGEDVLKKVLSFNPSIQVIIVSGQEKIGTAVKLLVALVQELTEVGFLEVLLSAGICPDKGGFGEGNLRDREQGQPLKQVR